METLHNNQQNASNPVYETRRPRATLSQCPMRCPPAVSAAVTTLANMITLNNIASLLVSVMIINPVKSIYNATIEIGNLIIRAPSIIENIPQTIKRINNFITTKNVTINDPEAAKSLLKGHRLSGNFSLRDEGIPTDFEPNDNILSCSEEHTKRLRSVYQHLFGSAQSRNKIRSILQKLMGELTSFQFLDPTLTVLTKKIAANILFGMHPNESLNALDFRTSTQRLEDIGQMLFELLQDSPNTEFLQWMQQKGLSESQIGQSLLTLFFIIEANVGRGLTELVRKTQFNHTDLGVRDAVSIDLQSLMLEGKSLWEAANASEIIDSVCVESLRYAPVVPEVIRHEKMDANRTLIHHVSIRALANANLSGSALEFCPMRYFGQHKRHWPSHDFLPFGYGRHECPAWWLYKQTAVYFLAALSMNFTKQGDRMIRNDELL